MQKIFDGFCLLFQIVGMIVYMAVVIVFLILISMIVVPLAYLLNPDVEDTGGPQGLE